MNFSKNELLLALSSIGFRVTTLSTILDPMLDPTSTRLSEIKLTCHLQYILYHLGGGLYNITLHPLAKVPGPKLRGAFDFPRYWEIWTGDVATNCKELHDIYGSTVRLAP
ncbi:cytochrome P450 protein [Rutstroemia sp. NJR-2017a WRK4]|nr:cytochrome P450 protein [Rutstroemia sp. NJR-2017a WRK4]